MSIIVDTNVLVRLITNDDPQQSDVAKRILDEAERLIISVLVLSELVWVLRRLYQNTPSELISVVELILTMEKAIIDRPAVAAGLAMLKAGGDFADGVIAFDGARLGGKTFVSFDKKACQLLERQGVKTLVLA